MTHCQGRAGGRHAGARGKGCAGLCRLSAGAGEHGSYACYSYASVITAGPINTTVSLGKQTGAVWIYSNDIYANGSATYTDHYTMQGNQIVASDGPFQKNNVVAYYVPDGLHHRKTIVMGYADGKGGTIGNSACTYNGK